MGWHRHQARLSWNACVSTWMRTASHPSRNTECPSKCQQRWQKEGVSSDHHGGLCNQKRKCRAWRRSRVLVGGVEVHVGLPGITCGCAMLFGLISALNLSCPQAWKCTFYAFQKILMNLDGKKFSPKLWSLKIKRLQWSIWCSHASPVHYVFSSFYVWVNVLYYESWTASGEKISWTLLRCYRCT